MRLTQKEEVDLTKRFKAEIAVLEARLLQGQKDLDEFHRKDEFNREAVDTALEKICRMAVEVIAPRVEEVA